MGGNKVIAWDFKGPDVEPEEVRESVRLRRQFIFRGWPVLYNRNYARRGVKWTPRTKLMRRYQTRLLLPIDDRNDIHHRPRHGRHVSFCDEASTAVPTDVDLSSAPSENCSPLHHLRLLPRPYHTTGVVRGP